MPLETDCIQCFAIAPSQCYDTRPMKPQDLSKLKPNPLAIEGWMSEDELCWLAEHAAESSSVVEIGSWKGRSTAALLASCKGTVTAVDHFQGSANELTTTHEEATRASIYQQFMANVGDAPNLKVLDMPSRQASREVEDASADMVFIDGAHDAVSVIQDLTLWIPKCRKLLCGHDSNFPSVQAALKRQGIKWTRGPGAIWYAYMDQMDGVSSSPIMKKTGVALAIVSGRGACPVAMLQAVVLQGWPTNVNFTILTIMGKDIDAGRTLAIEQAMEAGVKYLWFLDDDTVPPQDAARHMMKVFKEHPKAAVVGGIYTTRAAPPEPIVYSEQGAGAFWDWKAGEVFKCWGIGTGCMMIDLDVFRYLDKPWFLTTHDADRRESDDLHFCELVNQAGFEVWAHGGVLCHHYDLERGVVYMLPRGSKPYLERLGNTTEAKL